MAYEERDTEDAMLEVIRGLRENPEKYRAVRLAIDDASSDEERVQALLRFATSDRELAALMPARVKGQDEQALAWTTVTVTTVFIADSAY